ncbi:tetratricopeptide repeat protein [Hyphomonas oceanitis]|uniref:tetratricopeptide repeat protein n=1 Tax=Hyphomonas oceanitis TaxID=81033 RepID=UPI0030018357
MKILGFFPIAVFVVAASVPAANAQAIIYHYGQNQAETCAQRVAVPDENSDTVLHLCEAALNDEALSPATRAATLANTGIILMRQGNLDTALSHLQDANASAAASPDIAINLGAVLVRLGRFDEAIDVLSYPQTVSSKRQHVAYYNRALAHWARNDIALAYEDLKTATAIKPDYVAARDMLQYFKIAQVE